MLFVAFQEVVAGILDDAVKEEPNFVKSLKNCCNFVFLTESLWCLLKFLSRQHRNWFTLVKQQ
jgi:uncharacterized protein YifE (UPF0438 family)